MSSALAFVFFNSIFNWFRNFKGSNPIVFNILIDTYKKMGMLVEASNVFFEARNSEILPSLWCCNALLKDLLKKNMMELFWKVYNVMFDAKIGFDVYTCTSLVGALCKVGDVMGGQKSPS